LSGYVKALAIELAPHSINVNYVCPTAVNTPMIGAMAADGVPADHGERLVAATGSWNLLQEGAPPLEAGEVTQAVLWLASDASNFVTGAPLIVDAGFLTK
jgi:NAD(P)-dependent dehydrogenase (short-subunit alcohol dehydrogenase family)